MAIGMDSNSPKMTAPTIAATTIPAIPVLRASRPLAVLPASTEFQGSSFPLSQMRLQSIEDNSPPHTAKLPPYTGPRAFRAPNPYRILLENPREENRIPLKNEKIPPPIAPIAKPVPASSTILHGQGSL